MKHTKGKWEVRRTSTGFRIASENSTICLIDLFKEYPTEANAKLIAAAPELLEACKEAQEELMMTKPNPLNGGQQSILTTIGILEIAIKNATS